MTPIRFFAAGEVVGQPRAKAQNRASKAGKHFAHIYTPGTANGWKSAVAGAAIAAGVKRNPTINEAVFLELVAVMRRPASHYGSGKNSAKLKPATPRSHTTKPDTDNMAKAIMDALTDLNVWTDDKLVCGLLVMKRWQTTQNETPGCWITIRPAEEIA